MKKQLIFMCLMILLLSGTVHGFNPSVASSVALSPFSVADVNDVRSVFVNPAGLGVNTDFQFGFNWAYQNDDTHSAFSNDKALFIKTPLIKGLGFLDRGFAFSIQWLGDRAYTPDDYRKYSIAKGFKISSSLYGGVTFHWYNSVNRDIDSLYSFDLGLIYRLTSYLSLGFACFDINTPTYMGSSLPARFFLGIAARPVPGFDNLTVSWDFNINTDQKFDELSFDLGFRYFFINGIELSIFVSNLKFKDINSDEIFINTGISIYFPYSEIETNSNVRSDGDYIEGQLGAIISSQNYGNIIPAREAYLYIVLDNSINEVSGGIFLTGSSNPQLIDYITIIRHAADDPDIVGIIFEIRGVSVSYTQAQELHEVLNYFKEQGKEIITFLKSGWNKDYYLASFSDKIYMPPSSYLSLIGLSTTMLFYADFLTSIGVHVDVITSGDYKTGYNRYVESQLTDEHRENIERYFNQVNNDFAACLMENRNFTQDELQSVLDNGPYTSDSALDAGIIDGVEYFDDVLEELGNPRKISLRDYANDNQINRAWQQKPEIAVLFITGTIIHGNSVNRNLLSGEMSGDLTLVPLINQLKANSNIKGVIIRIDSGGGSALGSDQILQAVISLAEVKPVFISMASIAASGGYMIAIGGTRIFANTSTLTGSIGVLMGRPSIGQTLEMLQINSETISYAENSGVNSIYRPFTEHEREIIQSRIGELYQDFIEAVSENRDMTEDEVDAIGEGRLWSGEQARHNGLIDENGGLNTVLRAMEAETELSMGDYKIGLYPGRQRGILSILIDAFIFNTEEDDIQAQEILIPDLLNIYMRMFSSPLSWYPVNLNIE